MNSRCQVTHEALSAYVDGELTSDSAIAMSDHLTVCARCSSEYNALLTTVAAVRGGLARYTAPDVLRARVRAAIAAQPAEPTIPATRQPKRWSRAAAMAAAAVACIALGSGATLMSLRRSADQSTVASQVLASHVRSLMPDHLTDVRSSDQHNVKPWFNGRLDFSPSVPRLDDSGFPLIGGRLDYIAGRPVAVVVYGRRLHLINVFSWPSTGDDAPLASSSSHGYNMVRWRRGGVEQWIVSDLNASELHALAILLQRAELTSPDSARRGG